MSTDTPTLIQAVPWEPERTKIAVQLARDTGGEIIWDQDYSGLETFLRVLEAAGDGPMILLEDDVMLAVHWRSRVEAVIEQHPQRMILFFSMREKDSVLGSRLMEPETYYSTLCAYFPPTYAAQIREWVGDRRPSLWKQFHDHVPGAWLNTQRKGERYWLQVPSLVQHRGDLPSVATPKDRRRNRVSPSFEGVQL